MTGRGCVPVPLREALFLLGKSSNYTTFEGIFSNGMKRGEENPASMHLVSFTMSSLPELNDPESSRRIKTETIFWSA